MVGTDQQIRVAAFFEYLKATFNRDLPFGSANHPWPSSDHIVIAPSPVSSTKRFSTRFFGFHEIPNGPILIPVIAERLFFTVIRLSSVMRS